MKKRGLKVIGLVCLTLMVMVGCGKEKEESSNASTSAKTEKSEKMLTVTDGNEEEIEVKEKPKKVVVFDMGSLDTIRALGAEKSVVGVPVENVPTYLKEFKKVDSVGGIKEPDMEKINQLQPDLIIISGRQEDYKKELSEIAPTIYLPVLGEDVWGSTTKNINLLSKIFGEEKEGKQQIAQLEKNIEKLKEEAEATNQKALVTLTSEGQLSAYGHGSRFGIVHDTFGFGQADDNIEASAHGQSVSFEYVLEKNPDIIFVIDRTKAIGGDDTNNDVASNELIKKTTAGKENKVISLQPDVWYLSGGGIESTQIMIDDVAKALK